MANSSQSGQILIELLGSIVLVFIFTLALVNIQNAAEKLLEQKKLDYKHSRQFKKNYK